LKTTIITDDDLSYAVEVLKNGGLVAVPTDTVYGLAGNGLSADTVARIYEVKGRPSIKPIILLVADMSAAETVCLEIPDAARSLAEKFWPGPLTIVLKKSHLVPDIVTAGGHTIGIRCPNHPKTLELLRLAGLPAATPSANISGQPSPKSAGETLEYFDGKIECLVDGGVCALSIESTIIDMSSEPYKILRQGALGEEEIWRALASNPQ